MPARFFRSASRRKRRPSASGNVAAAKQLKRPGATRRPAPSPARLQPRGAQPPQLAGKPRPQGAGRAAVPH
eukprot:6317651-Alexandrium_andersonii.AAC.1